MQNNIRLGTHLQGVRHSVIAALLSCGSCSIDDCYFYLLWSLDSDSINGLYHRSYLSYPHTTGRFTYHNVLTFAAQCLNERTVIINVIG